MTVLATACFTAFVSADAKISKSTTRPVKTSAAQESTSRGPCGTTTITHSTSQTITPGNSASCNAGGLHTDNSYYRTFDLNSFGIIGSFSVCEVVIGIELAAGAGGTQPITVRLYNTTNLMDLNAGTEIASEDFMIANQVQTVIGLPILGKTTTGGLTVEIFTPNGQGAGNSFFIGSNAAGETAPSYLRAPACAIVNPTTTADIGFPNMHIVMNVRGTDDDCNNNNVPDADDIANMTSEDCNKNGIPDECEVVPDLPTGNVQSCETALLVGVPTTVSVSIGAGTILPFDFHQCGLNFSVYGVWFLYRASWTGTAFFGMDSQTTSYMLSAFDGCPSAGGMQIACNSPNPNGMTFHVERGSSYYIRVGPVGFAFGGMSGYIIGPNDLDSPNDFNANGIPDECDCLFDVNDDYIVDILDFLDARNNLGMCMSVPCTGDVDGDGFVDDADLQLILLNLGPCQFPRAATVTMPRPAPTYPRK